MEFHYLHNVLGENGLCVEVKYGHSLIDTATHGKDDAHIHDYCELYLNLQGQVSFSVKDTVYPVETGDLIISMPNEIHYCRYHENGIHEYYCLWVKAAGPFKDLLAPFWDRKQGERNRISLSKEDTERLRTWLDALLEEQNADRVSVKSAAAVLNVLNLLNDVKHQTAASHSLPAPLSEILAYIEEHVTRECSAGVLCEEFFISRSSLWRLFRTHLGTTPTVYVQNKRLAMAKTLLKEGVAVQQVCEQCGFSDYSHFIALFKKRFGVTPLKYSRT